MTEFHFSAASPGSGKTEAALRFSIRLCAELNHKAIFVLPTRELIDEVIARATHIREQEGYTGVILTAIHGGDGAGGVAHRIIAHAEMTPHDQPELLFITLRAFLYISPWPNRHAWRHVFVDEAFNPVEDISRQLVENHRVLTERVELVDPESEFSALRPRHGAGVRDSVTDPLRRGDEVNAVLHPVLVRLTNPNFTVYAHVPTWKRVVGGEIDAGDPRLFLYAEINASAFAGFESVTFMGAWLQNHAFFRLWSRLGHGFVQHPYLTRMIRSRGWNRSEDTIAYFTERHWTKTYSTSALPDGRTPLEHIDAHLRSELHGFDFGWTANARHELAYPGTRMAPRSAGLNGYDHLECLLWLAAMLPHPNMWRFLQWRGLDDDDVRMEFYWLPLAQFMARGADRRHGYEGRMVKVVPDLPAARFLCQIFSSRLERIGTIPLPSAAIEHTGRAGRPRGHPNRGGRPRSSASPEERRERRNQRDRERYALLRAQRPGAM